MADYNLQGLSTRSFEQLIQALSLEHISKGCSIFGDGPDGAREATFEGKGLYPTEGVPWEGYHVLQAKFLSRLKSEPHQNASWLKEQINDEFTKWERAASRRRPDYYILATNVSLSSVETIGGKDTVQALLDEWASKLGIIKAETWDYDKISKFLDASPGIRQTYLANILSGDILAELLKTIAPGNRNVESAITNFLIREVKDDAYARLEQAGDQSDARVPLARVFVDLPASTDLKHHSNIRDRRSSDYIKIIQLLCDLGAVNPVSEQATKHDELRSRIVLIGGPGQGKTTIGQFLCQLYRAEFLSRRMQHVTDAATKNAILEVQSQCEYEQIEKPSNCRFPLRLVLSRFAEWLSNRREGQPARLIDYVHHIINARSTQGISHEILLEWLIQTPWLLVLDGLDEVPTSSNRAQLLETINDFISEMRSLRSDGFVIATTRPQGYNKEFDNGNFSHYHLLPLTKPEALHYGKRLMTAKHGVDTARLSIVEERLKGASDNETTARLMTTPLQVTILATLVEHTGSLPSDRWKLFNQYYDVIYRRELEKDLPISSVLKEHRQHIDAIHFKVGFTLQQASQDRGATDAALNLNELGVIVESHFRDEGYEADELTKLVNLAKDAATDRLVFLVSPQQGKVGFEIRSLQEFMAAQYLTGGNEQDTLDNLRSILPSTFWRNVFLFAAGRCFADRTYLREAIIGLLITANQREGILPLNVIWYGSQVATDLLTEGAVQSSRKHFLSLLDLALRASHLPASNFHQSLADLYDEKYDSHYKNFLPLDSVVDIDGRLLLLILLADREISWALHLAEQWWSAADHYKRAKAINSFQRFSIPWLEYKSVEHWRKSYPDEIEDNFGVYFTSPPKYKSLMSLFMQWRTSTNFKNSFAVITPLPLRIAVFFGSIRQMESRGSDLLEELALCGEKWVPILRLVEFDADPSKSKLIKWLESIKDYGYSIFMQRISLTWISGYVLFRLDRGEAIHDILHSAQSGALGDTPEWIRLEDALISDGLTIDLEKDNCRSIDANGDFYDLEYWTSRTGPLTISKEHFNDLTEVFKETTGVNASLCANVIATFTQNFRHTGFKTDLDQESFLKFINVIHRRENFWEYVAKDISPDTVDVNFWNRMISESVNIPDEPYLYVKESWKDSLCEFLATKRDFRILRFVSVAGLEIEDGLPCRVFPKLNEEDSEYRWLAFNLDLPYLLAHVAPSKIFDQIVALNSETELDLSSLLYILADESDEIENALALLTLISERRELFHGIYYQDVFDACNRALSRVNHHPDLTIK